MVKFIAKNKVRMHDTDMAGILYFARQFRYAHDALEDLLEQEGISFHDLFTEETYAFVIVHCEGDYYMPLRVGDNLEIHLHVEHIGSTSFSLHYDIFRGAELVGTAKTVHVTIDRVERVKIPIPETLRNSLSKYAAVRS
jgi:1,4-dihydroxy-2-naphthoyl-CoA hydrolase